MQVIYCKLYILQNFAKKSKNRNVRKVVKNELRIEEVLKPNFNTSFQSICV